MTQNDFEDTVHHVDKAIKTTSQNWVYKALVFPRSLVIGLPVALGRSRGTPGSGSCISRCIGSTLLAGVQDHSNNVAFKASS